MSKYVKDLKVKDYLWRFLWDFLHTMCEGA